MSFGVWCDEIGNFISVGQNLWGCVVMYSTHGFLAQKMKGHYDEKKILNKYMGAFFSGTKQTRRLFHNFNQSPGMSSRRGFLVARGHCVEGL
jgi:hypothetical protein